MAWFIKQGGSAGTTDFRRVNTLAGEHFITMQRGLGGLREGIFPRTRVEVPFICSAAIHYFCYCCLVAKSCLSLCNPMDCNPPGSFNHGIPQARIVEWVAIYFSRGSSRPRDWTCIPELAGRFFITWATREPQNSHICLNLQFTITEYLTLLSI